MHELYELKEKLMKELAEYSQGELSTGSLEVIDKLAHAIKNICKICDDMEGSSYEGGSSYGRRSYEGSRRSYDGSYDMSREGGSNRSYEGSSYRRGVEDMPAVTQWVDMPQKAPNLPRNFVN